MEGGKKNHKKDLKLGAYAAALYEEALPYFKKRLSS